MELQRFGALLERPLHHVPEKKWLRYDIHILFLLKGKNGFFVYDMNILAQLALVHSVDRDRHEAIEKKNIHLDNDGLENSYNNVVDMLSVQITQ